MGSSYHRLSPGKYSDCIGHGWMQLVAHQPAEVQERRDRSLGSRSAYYSAALELSAFIVFVSMSLTAIVI